MRAVITLLLILTPQAAEAGWDHRCHTVPHGQSANQTASAVERVALQLGAQGWRMVSASPVQGAMIACFIKPQGEVPREGAATQGQGRYFNDSDHRELAWRLIKQPCIGNPLWLPKAGATVRFAPPIKRTSDRHLDERLLQDRLMAALRKDPRARLLEPEKGADYTVRLSLSSNTDPNGASEGREIRTYYGTLRVTAEDGEILCINNAQLTKVHEQAAWRP